MSALAGFLLLLQSSLMPTISSHTRPPSQGVRGGTAGGGPLGSPGTPPGDDWGDAECYEMDGAFYDGKAAVTRSGQACAPWETSKVRGALGADPPRAPRVLPPPPKPPPPGAQDPTVREALRLAGLRGVVPRDNLCRNPSDKNAPWCPTAGERGWDYCTVPKCKLGEDSPIVVPVDPSLREGALPAASLRGRALPAGRDLPPGGEEGGGEGGGLAALHCPTRYTVHRDTYGTMRKYDALAAERTYDPSTAPLHFYSMYGATTLQQWDEIVRAHVGAIGYSRGETVFEAGCAAGAFVDSLARQYGVRVAGVDVSQAAVRIARSRIPAAPLGEGDGKGGGWGAEEGGRGVKEAFCAANAENLMFVPSDTFDHAVSFAALLYARDGEAACRAADELVRIVKPGGTVFLGQLNDPEMRPFAGPQPEGTWAAGPLMWHRFSALGGHEVTVRRAEDVYSRRVMPRLEHYDLHAPLRYNVYIKVGVGWGRNGGREACELGGAVPQPDELSRPLFGEGGEFYGLSD